MKSFRDYEPSIYKYVSKWLAEKKEPSGINKQEEMYDIDETILYYSPSADKIEKEILYLFGYEIGIAEAGEDWEVFLIRPNDINGNTYISFIPKDLEEQD